MQLATYLQKMPAGSSHSTNQLSTNSNPPVHEGWRVFSYQIQQEKENQCLRLTTYLMIENYTR